MKKILSLFFAVMICAAALAGCGTVKSAERGSSSVKKESVVSETSDSHNTEDDRKLQIVTTIFPEYDWVNEILGDKRDAAEVTMLLDNGVDLHSYQPTAADIAKISTCDLFVYVGGESDVWIKNALAEATNKDMKVINLLEVLGDSVKEEEVVEGMEAEHEEEAEGEEEGPEYDEHVWLSLRNAKTLCASICDDLCALDSANAESYKANLKAYTDKLDVLDKQYSDVVDKSTNKTVLFGDRFPFRYMADDYGIKYYAAFVGCSAETECSFNTIIFLAGKVDELSLPAVLTIEGPNHDIAQTVVDNTKAKSAKILTLDSMQSITSDDAANGKNYLSIMTSNLDILKEALN